MDQLDLGVRPSLIAVLTKTEHVDLVTGNVLVLHAAKGNVGLRKGLDRRLVDIEVHDQRLVEFGSTGAGVADRLDLVREGRVGRAVCADGDCEGTLGGLELLGRVDSRHFELATLAEYVLAEKQVDLRTWL